MKKNYNKADKIVQIIKKVIDFILVIFLVFLSIKKGGFYKTDNLEFNLVITFIGTLYILFLYIVNILKKYIRKKENYENENNTQICNIKNNFDIIEILLLLLSFSYLLPIIFNNYSNLSDSIFEMIRYFNIYIIYVIVKKSANKKLYINSILFIVFIQCILGIDGLANRYFLPLLNKLNSGYLTSDNLTRMSATIQYANVFSLLCILVDVYLIDKFKNVKITNFNNIIEYFLIFVFTSSIILSKSRIIFVILICYLIYIFISKKTKNKFFTLLNILTCIIYTTIFMKLLLLNSSAVYLLTFSFYMLVIILYILRNKIYNFISQVKEFVCNIVKNKKVIYIITFSLVILYLILAFCIKVPIKLDYNVNQNYVLRNIYNLKNGIFNEISIKIKKDHEDSRYKIEIFEVNDKFESTLLQTYNYYSTITDTFEFEYIPKEDFENLIIKITCEKNSIQVLELLVNSKDNYIDYLLLPTDVVYRITESLKGDLSLKGRLYFIKDAISLTTLNTKNFLIGLGGEGFKNTYELVKNNNYTSTEVHNVYLQIFVESGIVGLAIFCILMIVILKNYNFDIMKLLVIIFCITSLFDLNFSYMLSMSIFAILLALLNEKNTLEKKDNKIKEKYLKILEVFKVSIISICGIVLVGILVKANIAYYMKIPKITYTDASFEEINKSVESYEKRVQLDPFETTYRYSLHLEYEKYLNILSTCLEKQRYENIKLIETEYKNVVNKMENNLLIMQKNDKYDIEVLVEVTNNVIEYIDTFVDEKCIFDKEAGYCYYLNMILENIDYISNLKYYSKSKEAAITLYEYCYNKLLHIKFADDTKVISQYLEILKEKVK